MQSLKLSEIVINWYKKNLRTLPWRPKNFNKKIYYQKIDKFHEFKKISIF